MIKRVADSSGINFTVVAVSIEGRLTAEFEINIYRVIQKCLNNIVKHLQASLGEIFIRRDAHSIQIMIKDNGRGFEFEQVMSKRIMDSG
jgi:signal transduction histidine kinase